MTRASWYGLSVPRSTSTRARVAAAGARLGDGRVDRLAVGVAEVDDDLADEHRRAAAPARGAIRPGREPCGASGIGASAGSASVQRRATCSAACEIRVGAGGPFSYRQLRGFPECFLQVLD